MSHNIWKISSVYAVNESICSKTSLGKSYRLCSSWHSLDWNLLEIFLLLLGTGRIRFIFRVIIFFIHGCIKDFRFNINFIILLNHLFLYCTFKVSYYILICLLNRLAVLLRNFFISLPQLNNLVVNNLSLLFLEFQTFIEILK